jgi:hypothetical protein
MSRSVLIIGTNSQKYLDFALNCAESIRFHNPKLKIYVGTNIKSKRIVPGVHFIEIEDRIAKLYIETKLYLDTFLQTEETLYIDSDMICYGSLDPIFDACSKMDVTVLGKTVPLDEYWGIEGAKFARETFHIDQSILFNGGLYFLRKSMLTTKIYNTAREVSERYDEYGFRRIQYDWKNEEEMVSIGMIANKQLPLNDGELFVAGFVISRMPKIVNVLKGQIYYEDFGAGVPDDVDVKVEKPLLFHFGGEHMNTFLYKSQVALLRLHKAGFPTSMATLIVNVFINFPYQTYKAAKKAVNIFRK